jgi:hypothetical protein
LRKPDKPTSTINVHGERVARAMLDVTPWETLGMALWRSIFGRGRTAVRKDAPKVPVVPRAEPMLGFESLGDNCEFGLVQRLCGAEPLGLFRFHATILSNLVAPLREDLQGLFDSQDLEVYGYPYDGQYACRSRRFRDFEYLSGVWPSTIGVDEFHMKQVQNNDCLKTRLGKRFARAIRFSCEKVVTPTGTPSSVCMRR